MTQPDYMQKAVEAALARLNAWAVLGELEAMTAIAARQAVEDAEPFIAEHHRADAERELAEQRAEAEEVLGGLAAELQNAEKLIEELKAARDLCKRQTAEAHRRHDQTKERLQKTREAWAHEKDRADRFQAAEATARADEQARVEEALIGEKAMLAWSAAGGGLLVSRETFEEIFAALDSEADQEKRCKWCDDRGVVQDRDNPVVGVPCPKCHLGQQ